MVASGRAEVRVRFAPSPTGELHIGGARTALFNWLFARHYRGKFILRIEDTDVARSSENFYRVVLDNLKWLGLDWDEGPEKGGRYSPYLQSQRLHIYEKYAHKLLEEGKAYLCYCTPQELEDYKRRLEKEEPLRYSGKCRNLSSEERKSLEAEGRKPALRFRVPPGTVWVDDLLRGRVSFENRLIGDFIILKSDGTPTYNFACVIDDSLMKITHIIRGDEHLPNTPRQVLLYCALDFPILRFAHIPLILGRDSSKLSKRHGAPSVSYYREQGYLPWTMVNYLALLGWSTSDSQQFFGRDELIQKFTLERVGKSAAIFDPMKLEWMNGEYIRRMDLDELVNLLIPYLRRADLIEEKVDSATRQKILKVARLEQERIKVLSQIVDLAGFFFTGDFAYDPISVEKRLKKDYVPSLLEEMRMRIEALSPFEEKELEELLRRLARDFSLSPSEVFHPLRVALTGIMKGPGLFELAGVLGKEEVIRRIERTLEMHKNSL